MKFKRPLYLDIEMAHYRDDPVSNAFYTTGRQGLEAKIIGSVNDVFVNEVRIPVTGCVRIPAESPARKKGSVIKVTYSSNTPLLNLCEEPVLYDIIEGFGPLFGMRTRRTARQALKDSLLEKASCLGLSDWKARRISITPQYLYRACTARDDHLNILTKVLVHEVGHIFQLAHAQQEMLPDGRFNIMSARLGSQHLYLPYGFSDKDKEKILSQVYK